MSLMFITLQRTPIYIINDKRCDSYVIIHIKLLPKDDSVSQNCKEWQEIVYETTVYVLIGFLGNDHTIPILLHNADY